MTANPHNSEEPLIKTEYTDIKTEDIEDPERECEVPKTEAENEDVRWPSSSIGCNFSDFKERGKVEPIGEFYFESDHLALKEERRGDYKTLLQVLAVLEAQKVQAVTDYECLLKERAKARTNPLALVEALQRGQGLQLPEPQVIASLPEIDWIHYHLPEEEERKLQAKRTVRVKEKYGVERREGRERGGEGEYLVRGRVFQTHKPVTFNQPWSREEQKRLEELLERFPTEETEMERWKKIATEMGNRTPVQVQSRVQKYFLKLQRAGLPVPGRLPPQRNKNRYFRSGGKRRAGASLLPSRTTFLASVVPEVLMEEEGEGREGREEERDERGERLEEGGETSSEDEWPSSVKDSDEYRELRWLLRVRREKEAELCGGSVQHTGHSCARCGGTPVLGTRWQCRVCPQVSLCNDCVARQWSWGSHTDRHRLRPVRQLADYCQLRDRDYM